MECRCQALCHSLADITDTQPKQHPFKRYLFGFFKARHQVTGTFLRPTFQTQQVRHLQYIQIGNVFYQSGFIQIFYRFRTDIYIHGAAGNEMFDTTFNLRRTTGFIRTIMGRLPFRTIQRRTAFRASLDKSNFRTQQHRTGIDIDTNDLRNDLSAFFYIYIISQMQIQSFNNICVMQRGTFDGRPSQQYRFQIGNRSNCPCASYLKRD